MMNSLLLKVVSLVFFASSNLYANSAARCEPQLDGSWIAEIGSELSHAQMLLADIDNAVTIFGSARFAPDHKYSVMATDTARKLAQMGYPIVTGGGPGIMYAANKGGKEGGAESIGLNIKLPFEEQPNPNLTRQMEFNHFQPRKLMLMRNSAAFVVFPGGYGTMDELFEILTLRQTKKQDKGIIILVGKEFWSGLIKWIEESMVKEKTIGPLDVNLMYIVDSADEAVSIVNEYILPFKAESN